MLKNKKTSEIKFIRPLDPNVFDLWNELCDKNGLIYDKSIPEADLSKKHKKMLQNASKTFLERIYVRCLYIIDHLYVKETFFMHLATRSVLDSSEIEAEKFHQSGENLSYNYDYGYTFLSDGFDDFNDNNNVCNNILYGVHFLGNTEFIKDNFSYTETEEDIKSKEYDNKCNNLLYGVHFLGNTKNELDSLNEQSEKLYTIKSEKGVTLNSKILRKVLGRNSELCIDILKLLGYIEILDDGKFNSGYSSRNYKTGSKLDHVQYGYKNDKFDNYFKKSLKKYSGKAFFELQEHIKKMILIYGHVKYNYTAANEFIDSFIHEKPNKTEKSKAKMREHLRKLMIGNFHAKQNGKVKRLFSIFTSMHEGLRSFIIMDENEITTEVDMSNCQPTLLPILAYNQNYKIDDDFISDIVTDKVYTKIAAEINKELTVYNEETTKLKKRRKIKEMFDRKKAKKQFMVSMNGQNEWKLTSRFAKVFQKLYPKTLQFILYYKKTYGYNMLSIDLQRLEAQFILDLVGTKLLEMNILFITVHDAIIVAKNNSELVKNIMIDTFYDNFGHIINNKINVKITYRNAV